MSDRTESTHPNEWQFQDAQAHLDEVIRLALSQGPQRITKPDAGTVVVMPVEEPLQPASEGRKQNLAEFFGNSPLVGSGIDLTREDDYGRDIDL